MTLNIKKTAIYIIGFISVSYTHLTLPTNLSRRVDLGCRRSIKKKKKKKKNKKKR